MKVICAWCNVHIKGNEEDKDVSHGVCKPCMKQQLDLLNLDLNKQEAQPELVAA